MKQLIRLMSLVGLLCLSSRHIYAQHSFKEEFINEEKLLSQYKSIIGLQGVEKASAEEMVANAYWVHRRMVELLLKERHITRNDDNSLRFGMSVGITAFALAGVAYEVVGNVASFSDSLQRAGLLVDQALVEQAANLAQTAENNIAYQNYNLLARMTRNPRAKLKFQILGAMANPEMHMQNYYREVILRLSRVRNPSSLTMDQLLKRIGGGPESFINIETRITIAQSIQILETADLNNSQIGLLLQRLNYASDTFFSFFKEFLNLRAWINALDTYLKTHQDHYLYYMNKRGNLRKLPEKLYGIDGIQVSKLLTWFESLPDKEFLLNPDKIYVSIDGATRKLDLAILRRFNGGFGFQRLDPIKISSAIERINHVRSTFQGLKFTSVYRQSLRSVKSLMNEILGGEDGKLSPKQIKLLASVLWDFVTIDDSIGGIIRRVEEGNPHLLLSEAAREFQRVARNILDDYKYYSTNLKRTFGNLSVNELTRRVMAIKFAKPTSATGQTLTNRVTQKVQDISKGFFSRRVKTLGTFGLIAMVSAGSAIYEYNQAGSADEMEIEINFEDGDIKFVVPMMEDEGELKKYIAELAVNNRVKFAALYGLLKTSDAYDILLEEVESGK